ncbi:hypothetical protein CYMTET_20519 [Cymbomonas tetramitiformis]|uniref:Uncharacterized protein n=1 Tax=Cymbomonas tetramitiformis TaxID=36881 RepID=A0AAE0G414_9CHLO|nr:hypothetical protein CYMTET_20519 [Cymbomonas tetramitiformis]
MHVDYYEDPDGSDSKFCKRSNCDTTFIVYNCMAEKKSTLYQVDDAQSLIRFEFVEMGMHIVILKYGKGQCTNDLSEAIEMLIQQNILPHMPPIVDTITIPTPHTQLYFMRNRTQVL